MEDVNDNMGDSDVVLVIGANDTVNPAAERDESSELYGMPVVRVWDAGQVFVLKRTLGAGYSGSESPLFYEENTSMLLGNAKDTCDELRNLVKEKLE